MNNQLIICPQKAPVILYLEQLKKKKGISERQFMAINQDQAPLLIKQIRHLRHLAAREYHQPLFFVLWNFGSASLLAQNAFLKTLEEHQENLNFILISNSLATVLPTIQSRCQIIHLRGESETLNAAEKEYFLQLLQAAKQTSPFLLSSYLHLKGKNKSEQALSFLDRFLRFLQKQLHEDAEKGQIAHYLKQSLIAKELIIVNHLDPETALDQIFLS